MKKLIQAEAIVPFLISVLLINRLPVHFAWWIWIPIFLAPDLSMRGYLINNKVGAFSYNLLHHQLVAVVIAGTGMLLQLPYRIGRPCTVGPQQFRSCNGLWP
ncbi:MAG: DUF4260 family protein [Bacteroidota bacterium]